MRRAPAIAGARLTFISTTIIADWAYPIGNFILFGLCELWDFGLDKKIGLREQGSAGNGSAARSPE
jgi:hypothetical protein